jgi:hypothetical protein
VDVFADDFSKQHTPQWWQDFLAGYGLTQRPHKSLFTITARKL